MIAATIIAVGLCALTAMAATRYSPLFWPMKAAVILIWLWVLWFFRDPQRQTPTEGGLFISPADGRVADITPLGADGPLGREAVQIGIFMNVFSVHVNRTPCAGRVESVEHLDGAFMDIRKAEAILKNESTTIRMMHHYDGCDYPIIVRQVAGLVARRIVTDLSPGQSLERGERIGMIKFGSRLEIVVPVELVGEVCVQVGQRAWAGRTILISTNNSEKA